MSLSRLSAALLSLFSLMALPAQADLPAAAAYWLEQQTLAWKAPPAAKYLLCHDPMAQMYLEKQHHRGGNCQPLKVVGQLSGQATLRERFPHLAELSVFKLSEEVDAGSLLRQQLWLEARNSKEQVLAHTGLQTAGILDAAFSYSGTDLGLSFIQGRPHFRLWAPTAQQVELEYFGPTPRPQPLRIYPMQRAEQGTWVYRGEVSWRYGYYRYRIKVYRPDSGRLETHSVTDPWSVSLAADSTHSQIVDLQDPALFPAGWQDFNLPTLEAPEDAVLYELHVRDFSIADPSVPAPLRGKFAAFSQPDSFGVRHLRQLAASGLSHVHLLPVFDIATIPERTPLHPRIPLAPPDSELQQAALGLVRDKDSFNWGYDPLHYGVPEGSYATDPQGPARILEFRQMIQSLGALGLRAVMDVVYNHTHAAGVATHSVLDKIVPGYYYRLDAQGQIQKTSCCPDTASEHTMMAKLMLDTLLLWARDYKVGGFRFDLMGHHTTHNLIMIRQALDQLKLDPDGIDGQSILLYGEGWKFGSLDALRPDLAMNQVFGRGLGVGMFNDRLRDSARGGNYDHSTRSDQGFATGLYTDPNHSPFNRDTPADAEAQRALLLNYADNLRVGLAGGLQDYRLENAAGQIVTGREILYRGTPGSGFTLDPQESINYVSAHDNYELWDQIAAKAPFATPGRQPATASAEERLRMQMLALSLPLLGQGIPFLHAGSELLRSKSGDGDSYDSGDWFNLIDWRGLQHGWGLGLPPAWRNAAEWDFWRPRLTHPELKPSQFQMLTSLAQVHRLLRLRSSSPLFRLRTAADIQKRVHFLNTGPGQIPGVIALEIQDQGPGLADRDPLRHGVLILWNASRQTQTLCQESWKTRAWTPFARPGEEPLLEQTLTLQVGAQIWSLAPPGFGTPAQRILQLPSGSGCLTIPSQATLVYHEWENF